MATANLLQTSVSGGTQNALSLQGDGVFFPKASTTSRLALTLTATDKGFIVYDTTDNNIYFWNGTAWESIPGSGDAGANGSVQYNDNGIVSGATNFVWDKVNGRVGIGVPVPLSTVQSAGTVSVTGGASTGAANGLHLRFDTATNTAFIVAFHAGVDNRDLIYDARSHVWRLASGTGLTLNTTGNLVLKDGTVGANGVGVTFPAVQVASSDANCLDDYEEGTFLPVISTGATAVTYSVQTGRYTKIGRIVEIHIQVTTTAATRDANQFIIGGLPFSSSNFGSGVIGYSNSGFVSTAGGNKPNLYVSLTGVEFYTSAGGSFAGTTIANDAFDLRFSATYFV
jgi:hypothetical protein